MKKFIVKFKDRVEPFGVYSSREEASKKIMAYINDCNEDLDEDFVSPFDFTLEEVECKEVNEVITDFKTARKAIGVKPNDDYLLVSGEHHGKEHDGVERLVREINPKHIEALIALNELFTIAEAWNKEDGFVPDFSDLEQDKWFPWFVYDKDAEWFVCAYTSITSTYAAAYFGSRLCFKSSARAAKFGKQFADIYNKVFL